MAPNDPLTMIPEGPGPIREEVWKIRQEVTGKAKKRKLGDTKGSVSGSRGSALDELT
jgi:hypothetical protein